MENKNKINGKKKKNHKNLNYQFRRNLIKV